MSLPAGAAQHLLTLNQSLVYDLQGCIPNLCCCTLGPVDLGANFRQLLYKHWELKKPLLFSPANDCGKTNFCRVLFLLLFALVDVSLQSQITDVCKFSIKHIFCT